MATLRNKRKFAALNKDNCKELPRSNLALNSNVPRSQADDISHVSEEIEERVTKKIVARIQQNGKPHTRRISTS